MSSRSAMTLRMVAGERPRMCRRATAREPTGSAVRTYSAMTATKTSRLRRSRVCVTISSYLTRSEQLDEQGVGEQEPRLGESDATTLVDEQPLLLPRLEERGQASRLERDPLLDPRPRNAVSGAEAEDEPLGQPLPRRQRLVASHRKLRGFGESAVPLDRLHVDVAHVAQKAGRARSEPEVLFRAPVDLVVGRPPARPRVVGDLVVLVAGLSGRVDEAPVLVGHGVFPREPLDARRVPEAALVESERVGGEVVGLPLDQPAHRRLPGVRIEPRQPVDEVGADVVEARRPRGREGFPRLPGRVEPPEPREDPVVEALDTEADAAHPGPAVAGEALAGHALRVALDGDLGSRLHREADPEPLEDCP